MKFFATEDKVKVSGRTIFRDNVRYLGYSATAVTFTFVGKHAEAEIISDPENRPPEQHAWIAVYYDDNIIPEQRLKLAKLRQTITLFQSDEDTEITITIMKYSEPEYAVCGIESISIDTENLLPPPAPREHKIQIIGDSITCGYGTEGSVEDSIHNTASENPEKAYSVRTARQLNADLEIVAWNGKGVITAFIGDEEDQPDSSWLVPMLYEYTDAGCSQQFFMEAPSLWEKWDHSRYEPDLIIINLGTNDCSYTRDIPERQQAFCLVYQGFLRNIHKKHPHAKILCTLGIMDQRLCPTVEQAVKQINETEPDIPVEYLHLPMQEESDGLGTFWHPTPATHKKAAKLVVAKAREMMNW